MFDFTTTAIKQMVIHQVGNKLRDEGVFVSPAAYTMKDGNLEELMMKYFLSSFKDKAFYKFDTNPNDLYVSLCNIFVDPSKFHSESVNILKTLYEKSSHPQIRGGEFYMVHFEDCIVNEQNTNAIGIFKTEKKNTYLKVTKYANEFLVGSEKCIDVKKLDKGCIVFNIDSSDGFRVALVDNAKKANSEGMYWQYDFLRINKVQDSYFHTENCLNVCQDFVENIYGEIHQADKKDKVVLMNDAVEYFNQHSKFDLEDFVQEVIKDPEIIEQFKGHKESFDINQGNVPVDRFDISTPAVKTMKRKFKNLIKLDTDFEIKVKNSRAEGGNMHFIERGFDEEKGMHFYKVFFHEEE